MYKENVTVIMPVYNAEKYLPEAIESILGQSYSDFEFIITNDGSTDQSGEIIQQYAKKDSRITVISRENKRLVYTLNEQISKANGKYIVRMDADDISGKERIARQVRYMEENEDVYLAGCYYDLIIEPGTDKGLVQSMEKIKEAMNSFNNNTPQHIFMGYVLLHPTWIFNKELIKKIGGYKEYNHCEDGEFLFRVLTEGHKIGVIPEQLFKYRIRNTSKSCHDRLSNMGIKKDVLRYHMEYLEKSINGVFKRDYLVWGNDITGKMTIQWLQEKYPEATFKGFIDSFAEPDTEKKIFNPGFISQHKEYYVFIATNGGMHYAINYLDRLGRRKVKDYFSVV